MKMFKGYRVSDDGIVYSPHTGWKPVGYVGKSGYKTVVIHKKCYLVHRIVAHVYLGLDLSDKSLEVDHIDRDKNNNAVHNLQILTKKEHYRKTMMDTGRSFISDISIEKEQLEVMLEDIGPGGVMKEFGITASTLNSLKKSLGVSIDGRRSKLHTDVNVISDTLIKTYGNWSETSRVLSIPYDSLRDHYERQTGKTPKQASIEAKQHFVKEALIIINSLNGSVRDAASKLGVSYQTLLRRIKEHGCTNT